MMDQPVRNMYRKIVNVKKENKSVSSWKINKVFKNDAWSTKHKDTFWDAGMKINSTSQWMLFSAGGKGKVEFH